jgi:hypothetical protein
MTYMDFDSQNSNENILLVSTFSNSLLPSLLSSNTEGRWLVVHWTKIPLGIGIQSGPLDLLRSSGCRAQRNIGCSQLRHTFVCFRQIFNILVFHLLFSLEPTCFKPIPPSYTLLKVLDF